MVPYVWWPWLTSKRVARVCHQMSFLVIRKWDVSVLARVCKSVASNADSDQQHTQRYAPLIVVAPHPRSTPLSSLPSSHKVYHRWRQWITNWHDTGANYLTTPRPRTRTILWTHLFAQRQTQTDRQTDRQINKHTVFTYSTPTAKTTRAHSSEKIAKHF